MPSLDGGKRLFGDVISTSVSYHPILVVSSFLAFPHLLVHVRNNGVDVSNTAMNIRNEGVGLRDGYVCAYCELSLGKSI